MKQAFLCGASAAVVTIAALGASQAMAQAANPPPAGSENIGASVTVVAEKRTESIEKVPVAVTAFSSQQRQLLGIKTIDDLAEFTPGLSYFTGDDRAFIRGIGRQTDFLSVNPGVAIYKDGVYAGGNGSIALQQDTLFIDRIEVERGPQSTLFGRNSDGGLINYIWKHPTKDWEEEIRGGVDSYSKYWGEALVSGPINDNIRVLFGGNYTQENGGYWHNLNGGSQGGDVAQSGNGTSRYLVGQFEANYGNFDWWAKASTGTYLASWWQGPQTGPVDDAEFPGNSPSIALGYSPFQGLCALPGNTGLGCPGTGSFNMSNAPDAVVPGSVIALRHTAIVNPGAINQRDFIDDAPNTTAVRNDAQMTYHATGADIKYTGGYESFLYVGNFGPQSGTESGVLGFQLTPPTALEAALDGCSTLFFKATAGKCTQPLSLNFTDAHGLLFIEDEQFYSNELAISSTYQGPLQYLAGLYWFHDHYAQPINAGIFPDQTQYQTPSYLNLPAHAAPFFTPAAGNPASADFLSNRVASSDSYAGYGQLDWKATDTLKVTVGLRYTQDHTSGVFSERFIDLGDTAFGFTAGGYGANTPAIDVTPFFTFPLASACGPGRGEGPCVLNPTTGFVSRTYTATWDALTGTAGVEWTPDSHTLAYFKYSRGYKAGAFQTFIIASNEYSAPEYVDSYEAGLKLTHPTWQINGDVFYYNYTNDQQPLSVLQPGPTGFQVTTSLFNIPAVRTYGLELEGVWRPIDNLVINAQYSYLNATISDMHGACVLDTNDPLAQSTGANVNCPAAQEAAAALGGIGFKVQNVIGQEVPYSAQNKISVAAVYTWHFDPGSLALSGSVTWRDKEFGAIFNRPYDELPAYWDSGLRATWTDAKNRYTVIAFVDNIFDNIWLNNAAGALLTPVGNPGDTTTEIIGKGETLGPPTTYGVELQVRFR
jgi:iron complex outermembrane receptor protein